MNDGPKFLVEWSSRREEFLTAIGPALGRSPKRLAGEAQTGLFPYWGILVSWAFELLLLVAVIVIPGKLASMQPYEAPAKPKYDIIYYTGNELPKTEDVGGAQAGRSGRAGGREAFHPTQTIRVARGTTVRETVADAPKLNLPVSNSAVANLLALKALPGPAPAEGMRSSLRAPTLSQVAVAPAPQVPDQLRAAPTLNPGVIPPSAAAPQREVAALHLPGSEAVQVVAPTGFRARANEEPESTPGFARAQRGCASSHDYARDHAHGARLRRRPTGEADCSANGSSKRHVRRASHRQRLWEHGRRASNRSVGCRLGAAFDGGWNRLRFQRRCGAPASITGRRRLDHRPGPGQPRKRIWRGA